MNTRCPCRKCALYPGDCEDIRNGTHIVHCEDGKVRCVTLELGCAWYEHDPFSDVEEVQ